MVKVYIEVIKEPIKSTLGHKYYLPENDGCREVGEKHEHAEYELLSVNWVSACNLRKGDTVLLSDGEYGIVEKTDSKRLDTPETTCNLEVEDFHTYYVGENGVCVHNFNCNVKIDDAGTGLVPPEKITGYTRHGLDQAISRNGVGVKPSAILNTVNNPVSIKFRLSDMTWRYTGSQAVLNLNTQGQVVTLWAKSSAFWRIIP